MTYEQYTTFKVKVQRGIARVMFDNPPVNLITPTMVEELHDFTHEVSADDNVKVIIFESADPDIYLAHYDVGELNEFPDDPGPKSSSLNPFVAVQENLRNIPKATIAKIEGICRGGGSEFVLALDMRFGAIGKCVLGQSEVMVGIIPGGGGTQRLSRLMGRSRALEIVLSGMDLNAEQAEKYGYINQALTPKELTKFVKNLANRIAAVPLETIAIAKKSVLNAFEMPLIEGLLEESHLFAKAAALPESKERMNKYLKLNGQSRGVETTKR